MNRVLLSGFLANHSTPTSSMAILYLMTTLSVQVASAKLLLYDEGMSRHATQ
jgi:hypothetical protein